MPDLLPHLRDAAPLLAMLVLMEGLLSVDNILAIASLASELSEPRRRQALRLGLLGAYVFRALALLFAAVIVRSHTMMILGAAYLVHLAAAHFSDLAAATDDDPRTRPSRPRDFWQTVIAIQFLDLSLSLDNVIVAVGVAPRQLWVVYTGVALGLATLWVFATLSLRLLQRYPVLKHAAFLLVGFIGLLLLAESLGHFQVGKPARLAGSAAIIGLCLAYERSPAWQRRCLPVFRLVVAPLRLYEKCLRNFRALLLHLGRRASSAFRASR